MSKLRQLIFQQVKQIPKGKVATYKMIAQLVGTSPRVVGNMLHQNPDPLSVPCHRVIRSDGTLATGYAFGGLAGQAERLVTEGLTVKNGCIDLKQYGIVL